MKRILNRICAFATAVGMLLATGCDKTYVDDVTLYAPLIESFSPASAPVGTEIIITGQHLSGVTKAYIGDQEMVIKEKVSDTRLSIVAGANGRDGRIILENTQGKGESESEFTYSYAVPSLKPALLQESVVMGEQLLLTGTDLSAVEAVIFTAEGQENGHEGDIQEQSTTEIVARVPYVENGNVRITLRYFDGTSSVTTPLDEAPSIEVVRVVPVFDQPVTLERTAVGKSVTLTGENLDKVDRILVGEFEALISKQPTSLTFTVPAGDFQDGDTETTVVAEYFDGNETITLSEAFVVYVPYLMFWENMRVWAQGRDVESMSSFFSPQTGRVYANSDWRTVIDPISYQYQAATCSAGNTPNKAVITEEQYNSVNPYFFFSGMSAGQLQVNSPANSTGQLRNFYFENNSADEYRVTGVKGDCYGTPVLTFRYLDSSNAAEKALIDQVKNQTLEHIDEESFPIDVEAKTVGGIGISSAKGTLNSDVWAAGKYTAGTDAAAVDVDAVLMVLYYGYDGSAENVAANIRRIGFLHIRTVNFKTYNNTKAPSSSDVTFNCYWQKYDYDYSKLANQQ
ncbi:DNA-binding protein [Alistipes sp. An116]|uniref:IPT/TIG domain-containing protein n=1 Tax=Alistipes sp. An116 TaxID=1965546 RepID=UPI000B3697BE|nr:IPT/TIG domain-containing protein [Alistipes sp. An116]OUQ54248.1 DNA-binding protein [Alistipes sp. An116]